MAPEQTLDLRGLWVPIVTPFLADGRLDPGSLHRLANRILEDGVSGLVALGTTGEPATLSLDERLAVVEICGVACRQAGRSLILGAGTNSTEGTIDEIRRLCEHVEAAAALVVVPYYTRPSEQAVVEHFQIVADASPIPIIMYNIPYRTGRGLGSSALLEAAEHANIVGLKQSVGSIDLDTLDVLARSDGDFHVLAGDDAFIAPTVLMGGAGAISAAGNICTELFVAMTTAALVGDVERARELASALLPVVGAGFAEPSPAVWKGVLANDSVIAADTLRRPMTAASPGAVEQLLSAVAEVRASQAAASV